MKNAQMATLKRAIGTSQATTRAALFHLGVLFHSGFPKSLNWRNKNSKSPSKMAAAMMKGTLMEIESMNHSGGLLVQRGSPWRIKPAQ